MSYAPHAPSTALAVSGAFPPLPQGWTTPRPPRRLATASVVLALVWGAVQLVLAVAAPVDGLGRAAAGALVYATGEVTLVAVQVSALVVTGLWLRRSQVFATHLSQGAQPGRGGPWPWLAWVAPVVLVWFPYLLVRDLRTATRGSGHGGTVGVWWGWFLMMLVGTNPAVLRVLGLPLDEPGMLRPYEIVTTVVTAVALLLWIQVVRELTLVQRARAVGRDEVPRSLPA